MNFYCAIPFTINTSCQNERSAVIVTVPSIVLVPFFIYTSIPFVSNLSYSLRSFGIPTNTVGSKIVPLHEAPIVTQYAAITFCLVKAAIALSSSTTRITGFSASIAVFECLLNAQQLCTVSSCDSFLQARHNNINNARHKYNKIFLYFITGFLHKKLTPKTNFFQNT